MTHAAISRGSSSASYRRLPAYAKDPWRQKRAATCGGHAGLGPASLVLYDVSTLYFESDAGMVPRARVLQRSGAWTRRSPLACSPITRDFR